MYTQRNTRTPGCARPGVLAGGTHLVAAVLFATFALLLAPGAARAQAPHLPPGWVATTPITYTHVSAPGPNTPSASAGGGGRITEGAPGGVQPFVDATPPYDPAEIQGAYGISSLTLANTTGAGETIAIVDAYGDTDTNLDDLAQSDLQAFCTQYDLPYTASGANATLTEVYQGGVMPTSSDSNWAAETALDIEWAHAMAPGAKIVLVVTPDASDTLYEGVLTAASMAPIVSISWSGSEFAGEQLYDSTYFSTPNVAYFVGTGDGGSGANYPSCSPNVTAVGGTSLTISTTNQWVSETGWSGSGGGVSSFEALPAYENDWVTSGNRTIPDVSADADTNTGVNIYQDGGWTLAGGTSLATPLWAGMMAIVDANLGAPMDESDLHTALYGYGSPATLTTYFHDITSGSNGEYTAGVGYDMVTGLGTPIGSSLLLALADATPAPAFTPATGSYVNSVGISLSDSLSGAMIYYTVTPGTTGTTPTTESTPYNGTPINVTTTSTIEAIAIGSGKTVSLISSGTFDIVAAPPIFSVPAGAYSASFNVSLSDTTTGAVIHYTTNGVAPTASSPVYSTPLTVSGAETISAIAVAAGYGDSAVASATYVSQTIPALVVNTLADSTDNPGSPTVSLRDAINYANDNPGSLIAFTQGLAGTITLGSPLPNIAAAMTIQGSGAGVIAVDGNQAYTVFTITGGNASSPVEIDNLTIQNGSAFYGGGIYAAGNSQINACTISGNSAIDDGGGVCVVGTMALSNCTVTGNNSQGEGGGLYNDGNTTVTGDTIVSNIAEGEGGGLYNEAYATVTVQDCTFDNDAADGPETATGGGGGLYNVGSAVIESDAFEYNNADGSAAAGGGIGNDYYGSASVADCSLNANSSVYEGGGLYNDGVIVVSGTDFIDNTATGGGNGGGGCNDPDGTATFIGCTIEENDSLSGQGGGLGTSGIQTTIVGCTFSTNNAPGGYGGGLASFDLAETVADCTFSQNTALGGGGAVYVELTVSVINCTLVQNSCVNGAGIYADEGSALTLTNCTLTGNLLTGDTGSGGGLYNDGVSNLLNDILYGDGSPEIDDEAAGVTATYSDIQQTSGSYAGTGNINENPDLEGLGSNDGDVQTCALTAGSPCYGAGSSAGAPPTDARGIGRPSPPSMGAYDYGSTASGTLPAPTFSPNGGQVALGATVTISDSHAGATIYYTTDGLTPSIASNPYAGPVAIEAGETVSAIATGVAGYAQSSVSGATFTIAPTATPTFSPPAESFENSVTVSISDSNSGASIYYTTDGSTPNGGSTPYEGPITVGYTQTVSAIAVASGLGPSAVASAIYTEKSPAAIPQFSPAPGAYASPVAVSITCGTSASAIYYTLDGSIPSAASTAYTGPITVNSAQTIQAIAIAPGFSNSPVATAAYQIVTSSSLIVNTLADSTDSPGSGTVSLRDAVNTANGLNDGATIGFEPGLSGTIELANALPTIAGNMTIAGPGAGIIVVDGGQNCTIFTIDDVAATPVDTITGITVQNGSSTATGGVDIMAGTVDVADCDFFNNSSGVEGNGGGIYNDATLNLVDCDFFGNSAPNDFSGGGALYNDVGATATISGCDFTANNTTDQGGAIYNNSSATLTVTGSTFDENYLNDDQGFGEGGAIYNDGTMFLTNGTLYENSSSFGGGIFNDTGSQQTLTNCTFTGNSAETDEAEGGAIYNNGSETLVNDILFYDIAAQAGSELEDAGTTTATYTDIQGGGLSGTGNIETAPQLGALAENGGPVQTCALGAGSPCYGAGSPASAPVTDARNVCRPDPPSLGAFDYGTPVGTLPAPTFNPGSGTYAPGQTVTISDTVGGATVYFTTNGSAASTDSSIYHSPITVSGVETVNAIAAGVSGYYISQNGTANYVVETATATPGFTPGTESFSTSVIVTLSDSTGGAMIYYTTDGSTPSVVGGVPQGTTQTYSTALTLTATATVKAIATASGHSNSAVGSATYTIQAAAPTPSLNPTSESFTGSVRVTISDTLSTATIYYTTNGQTPTTSSSIYTAQTVIEPTTTTTVKAMAVATGYSNSAVASATYTLTQPAAATPTFSPPTGSYVGSVSVTISDSTTGAAIYYTTDGSTPSVISGVPQGTTQTYSAAFNLTTSATVNAIAIATGYATSAVGTISYTVTPYVRTVSVVAVSGSPGANVVVPIAIQSNGTENLVSATLTFDPTVLTYVSAAAGSADSSVTPIMNTTDAATGSLGFTITVPASGTLPSGLDQILNVTFSVASGASAGTTAVGFAGAPVAESVLNAASSSLTATFTGANVTIATEWEGDVLLQGSVTLQDWVDVGRIVVGLTPQPTGEAYQAADCAPRSTLGSGEPIGLADWVQTGRYLVGLDPPTALGGPTEPN